MYTIPYILLSPTTPYFLNSPSFLPMDCLSLSADDQAPIQAAGLWARGGTGHQGAGVLQTHRLGTPGQQRDPAPLQTQSGEDKSAPPKYILYI